MEPFCRGGFGTRSSGPLQAVVLETRFTAVRLSMLASRYAPPTFVILDLVSLKRASVGDPGEKSRGHLNCSVFDASYAGSPCFNGALPRSHEDDGGFELAEVADGIRQCGMSYEC